MNQSPPLQGGNLFTGDRVLGDGRRNAFLIQRLKDKLGNCSNASAEVEFERTQEQLIGEKGLGIAAIVEMVNYTRLDCMLGSAALVRQALAQALLEHPLMRSVLVDIALESETTTWLCMRLDRASPQSAGVVA